tara:strand:+ start:137 stop:634 length:498 start_codon:yes stop_codon:yes gene_type:complete
MSINILSNPCSVAYSHIKSVFLSKNFSWNYYDSEVGVPYYGHILLNRPETNRYSSVLSEYLEPVVFVVDEILKHNNFTNNYFYLRSAVNCTNADGTLRQSEKHLDHSFPHKNILLYLTDTGGKTFVEDEYHDPREDDVIIFSGNHWSELPKIGRRVVIVNTIYTF